MSGFPSIRPGQRLKPVGKQGLMSRNQANSCLAVCNAVLNSKVIDTQTDEFHITSNNATYGVARGGASSTFLGMHPFKLYATGEINGSGHIGYQVRSGIVEVRPVFHQNLGLAQPGWFSSWNQGNYSTPINPSNGDGAAPDLNKIITPATFFLDPTPEIIGGVNYGAYYAFWVLITPDTDNGAGYDGTVTIQYHRFTIQTGGSIYDGYVFPSLPAGSPNEALPIAVLQLKTETAFGVGFAVGSADGDVYQFKRDHYTGRFPAGQTGLNGFCFQGDWTRSGGVNSSSPDRLYSGNRWYYPGDMITYEILDDPTNSFNGVHVWVGFPGSLGGSPTTPYDGASAFLQISKI